MLFLLYSQDEINSNILLSLIFLYMHVIFVVFMLFLLYSQDEINSNILLSLIFLYMHVIFVVFPRWN